MREGSGVTSFRLKVVILSTTIVGLSACSGVLPRESQETLSPWSTFEEARTSFDKIRPRETQVGQLTKLGFDPEVTPNIKRLTYIDLLPRFLPNQSISLDHVHPAVNECIQARERCYGLEFNPGEIDRKRFGNVFLDIFGFVRRTRITGWRFNGLVLVKDDTVVYTIAGGEPHIKQLEVRKRPLGPLQEVDIRGNVDVN